MVNRNGLLVAKRRVTARVPPGQQRNNSRVLAATEIATKSDKEQGESLLRKFEQELAELTEACTSFF